MLRATHRTAGVDEFSKTLEKKKLRNSRRQKKGDVKKLTNGGPKTVERPVHFTDIHSLLLGACVLIHIFVR